MRYDCYLCNWKSQAWTEGDPRRDWRWIMECAAGARASHVKTHKVVGP